MRILFISNYYPPYEIGGYEQLCRDVAHGLTERGHEITILTSTWGIPPAASVETPHIHRELWLQLDYTAHLSPALQFFLTRPRAIRRNQRSLRRIVATFEPQSILMWNLQGLHRSLAVAAEALPNVATAYWIAGRSPDGPDEYWDYWSMKPKTRGHLRKGKALLSRLAWLVLHRELHPRPPLRHVAVVSEYLRRTGIEKGILPSHTQVIYNGVEIEPFFASVRSFQAGETLQLLQAGRITPDKGVHTTLEAMRYLVHTAQMQNIHLTLAGSGSLPYVEKLQSYVQKYALQAYVTFLGFLPREQMPALMARSHVLLLPTEHQEPFARVVLEALAAGMSVIGTETGGTTEILDPGITGLTFPADDSTSLAKEIERLLNTPNLHTSLATQGQQRVLRDFSLMHMIDCIETFLERAIEQCASPRIKQS